MGHATVRYCNAKKASESLKPQWAMRERAANPKYKCKVNDEEGKELSLDGKTN